MQPHGVLTVYGPKFVNIIRTETLRNCNDNTTVGFKLQSFECSTPSYFTDQADPRCLVTSSVPYKARQSRNDNTGCHIYIRRDFAGEAKKTQLRFYVTTNYGASSACIMLQIDTAECCFAKNFASMKYAFIRLDRVM
jgi:hypothetical protein